jgi:DNA repair protein RadD
VTFWKWVSKTTEIQELPKVRTVLYLFEETCGRLPTEIERISLSQRVLKPADILFDARLRASIIANITNDEIREIPLLAQGIEMHREIGGRTPSMLELDMLARKLGCVSEIALQQGRTEPQAPVETGTPAYGLYDYQRSVIYRTLKSFGDGSTRTLIHMPTGTGKTRTAMSLIARWLNGTNGGVAWATYSRELIDQAKAEFLKCWSSLGEFNAKIGYFTGDVEILGDARDMTFMSLSKLGRRINDMTRGEVSELASSISLLVIDEAHQAIAQTYGDAIDRLSVNNRKMKIVGLTATPGRTSEGHEARDTDMSQFFSQNKVELVVDGYDTPVDFLIDKGYLAQPVFEDIDVEGLESEDANRATIGLIQRAIDENHKRIIVFTESVGSAYAICAVINALGVECHAVDGSTPMDERNSIYQRYKKQSNRAIVLINYGVLTTGFDAPVTSAVIIARPVNSLIVYSQIIGRALRGPRAGGSACASIYNLYSRDEPEFRSVAKAFQYWNSLWSSH